MIQAYTLTNKNNISVRILNLGGIIHEIMMPNREGHIENIVHGFKDFQSYKKNNAFFGAIIGRIGGRIKNGTFDLNNKTYQIPAFDRGNALHGGRYGFNTRYFDVKQLDNSLILTYVSPDGEEGFPGEVKLTVQYTLTEENILEISYDAVSDQDTYLNLTNHTYFNLNPTQNIHNMSLKVTSDKIIELDETSIPTGHLMPVSDTPFDFNHTKTIGKDLASDHAQIKIGNGYDHPWVLRHDEKYQVVLSDETSGRLVEMTSDQNVVVLYSYNFPINGEPKHQALAIEFQNDPDSMHQPHFNSCLLKKGIHYIQKTHYKFSVE